MTHLIRKYCCDYCDRDYATNAGAKRHEAKCYYDPANKACATCAHLIASNVEPHWLEMGEDVYKTMWVTECDISLDHEDTGMQNGSIQHRFRANCLGWELRKVEGTYKFGKTFIEKVS
jgi:hypothetical protein